MATKHQVLALYAEGFPSRIIADRLDCMPEYVRATLKRAGLSIRDQPPPSNERRRWIAKRLIEIEDERKRLEDELRSLAVAV